MKTLITICLALAAGCTRKAEPPAQPLTPQQMDPPRDNTVSAVSGLVTSTGQGTLSLDSGGEKPFALRVDSKSAVVRDGQPAVAGDIREGDVVRAAYRLNDSGEPLAIEVTVNSRPVTDLETPPQAAAPPATAPVPAPAHDR
jgi:hypothetical protein